MKKTMMTLAGVCVATALFGGDVSLDGEWKLSYRHQQEGGEWKSVAARVPGEVNTALVGNGALRIDYAFEGEGYVNVSIYGEPPFDYAQVKAWLELER